MTHSAVLVLLSAAVLVTANAQARVVNPNFPYCKCQKSSSAYSLSSTVRSLGSGKYCFIINAQPPPGCTKYCCKSDLKKIEFNVKPECRVPVADVNATLNGIPTKNKPNFDFVQTGPPGATILRLTQLGLSLIDDGTELCIFLGSRKPGAGCTTLEQLCVPPKGMPAGVCSVALFDKENDCCPVSTPGVHGTPVLQVSPSPPPPQTPLAPSILKPPSSPALPPPPSPSPPAAPSTAPPSLPLSPPPPPPPASPSSSPPPSSPGVPLPPPPSSPPPPSLPPPPPLVPMSPDSLPPSANMPSAPPPPLPSPDPPASPNPANPCISCVYVTLLVTGDIRAPISLAPRCDALAARIAKDITAQAAAVGSELLVEPSLADCQNDAVKVCGTFASEEAGAKMQAWAEEQVYLWVSLITDDASDCPAYLNGYTVAASIAGDGDPVSPPANSFLNALASRDCQPQPIPFPACDCVTQQRVTTYSAAPFMTRMPGRKASRTLYCFNTITVEPLDPESPCGKSAKLLKAEIWADESQRRLVKGIGIQPAGAENMTFRATTWGGRGDDTLKATPLNWSVEDATGGKICFELENSTNITSFCKTGTNTCWINFFNDARTCCPTYPVTLVN